MMSITLPDELRKKLREEVNQSGLIANLLIKHYHKGEDPTILKHKLDALKHKYEEESKDISYQIEVIEKEKQEFINSKQLDIDREQRIEDAVKKRVAEMQAKHNG